MSENKSQQNDWQINLDIFEGPLDLLLHLINQLEIDIYDIPIAQITDQYLDYIHSMNILELDTAGNYLVMAATLISIKSQMLVPRNEDFEPLETGVDTEDPREHLIEMLVEYKKIKKVAQELKELEESRSFYVTKESTDVSEYEINVPLRKDEVSLDQLVNAFKRVWHERALRKPPPRIIENEEISISEKMDRITVHFNRENSLPFTRLVETPSKKDLVTTFLAVLELIKNNQVIAKQTETYGEIYLKYIGNDEV